MFWLGQGVPWRLHDVQTPAPYTVRFGVVAHGLPVAWARPDVPPVLPLAHTAEFTLVDWWRGRPEYLLTSRPPKGYRWLVVGDSLRMELIPSAIDAD